VSGDLQREDLVSCQPSAPWETDPALDNCRKVFDHVPSVGMSVALALMVGESACLNHATSFAALSDDDARSRNFREAPAFMQMPMKLTRGSLPRRCAS